MKLASNIVVLLELRRSVAFAKLCSFRISSISVHQTRTLEIIVSDMTAGNSRMNLISSRMDAYVEQASNGNRMTKLLPFGWEDIYFLFSSEYVLIVSKHKNGNYQYFDTQFFSFLYVNIEPLYVNWNSVRTPPQKLLTKRDIPRTMFDSSHHLRNHLVVQVRGRSSSTQLLCFNARVLDFVKN